MLISKGGASNIDSDDENLCKIKWGILGLNHIGQTTFQEWSFGFIQSSSLIKWLELNFCTLSYHVDTLPSIRLSFCHSNPWKSQEFELKIYKKIKIGIGAA